LGPFCQSIIFRGDPEHHFLRHDIPHVLGKNTGFFGSITPVLRTDNEGLHRQPPDLFSGFSRRLLLQFGHSKSVRLFKTQLIKARTGEGRARAKAQGVKFGRPLSLTPHQRQEALARRRAGVETLVEIARSYAVSHQTISRL
jgi:hypothetical protein